MMEPKLLNDAALSDCVDAATVIACTTLAGLKLEASEFDPPETV